MLEIVSKGFKSAKAALTGRTELTEANITEAMREIRVSLLEADVELGVVRTFLARVKERALGEVVTLSVAGDKKRKKRAATPGEHFVRICHNELEKLMGPVDEAPITFRRPLTTIMMVGLQGTGKTTTCGKLASMLKADKRKPLLVAADIYRPAAVQQLKTLGERLDVPVFAMADTSPPEVCRQALAEAKKLKCDVVILDTAGRLAIDDVLMTELEDIKRLCKPDNTFLVCDAMAGQDTVRTAAAFNKRLDLTGFVMTKLDGDARGGAALSIKEITGKPIKFLGTGENLDKLERFRPEGLASRILGMGDIVGLMQDFEAVVDERQAERDTKKMLSGKFTLEDFLSQLRMIQKIGTAKDIYEKLPIFGDQGLPAGAQIDDKAFSGMEAIIQSMTKAERQTPKIVDESRTKRIAKGSGKKPEQVTDLLQRFNMMHQMMANISAQPGLLSMLPGIKQLGQLGKLKGRGVKDLLGGINPNMFGKAGGKMPGLGGMGGGLPMGQGQMPAGMPGLPGMGNMPAAMGPGAQAPAGADAMGSMTPEQMEQMMQMQRAMGMGPRTSANPKQKQKSKDKRKNEKKARKKARR